MPQSRFFRIATEGATIDGRTIDRAWIEQMAASYDPATYTALVNCEHIAGYSPDRPFNSYGSVTELKAEEVTLKIDGKDERRLALFARIDANKQLVEINKAGQKLFASCEIHPNFAESGKAYLVGLAVTDRPASLGLEPLKFAALTRSNVFTPAAETALELVPEEDTEGRFRAGLFSALTAFFKAPEGSAPDMQTSALPPPAPTPSAAPAPANDNAQMNVQLTAFSTALGAALKVELATATAPLKAELDSLKASLAQPLPFSRSPATGRTTTNLTDC